MATKKPLRIGLIGYGFMGRTHSNAFRKVPNFFPDLKYKPELAAVCARNKERAEDFAEQWGYESVETDWKKLIARDDIDVIDIAAPNNVHHDIAIAAAQAGKAILCEKPLATKVEEENRSLDSITCASLVVRKRASPSSSSTTITGTSSSSSKKYRPDPNSQEVKDLTNSILLLER